MDLILVPVVILLIIIFLIVLSDHGFAGFLIFLTICALIVIFVIISPFFVIVSSNQLGSLNHQQLNPGIHIKSPFDNARVFTPNIPLGYANVGEGLQLGGGKLLNHRFTATTSDSHIATCSPNGFDYIIDPSVYIKHFNGNQSEVNNYIDAWYQKYTREVAKHYTGLDFAMYTNKQLDNDLTAVANTKFWSDNQFMKVSPNNVIPNPIMVTYACYDKDVQDQVNNIKFPGMAEAWASAINTNSVIDNSKHYNSNNNNNNDYTSIVDYTSNIDYDDKTSEVRKSMEETSKIEPTQYSYKTTADYDKFIIDNNYGTPVDPNLKAAVYSYDKNGNEIITYYAANDPAYQKLIDDDFYKNDPRWIPQPLSFYQ